MVNIEPVPKELVSRCLHLIMGSHGHKRLNLAPLVWQRNSMLTLCRMPDAVVVMSSVGAAVKLSYLCWFLGLVSAITAFIFSYWLLLPSVLFIALARYMEKQARQQNEVLAAFLLALEMLNNDFAGWGAAYPEARDFAHDALGDSPTQPQTAWLDMSPARTGQRPGARVSCFGTGVSRACCHASEVSRHQDKVRIYYMGFGRGTHTAGGRRIATIPQGTCE